MNNKYFNIKQAIGFALLFVLLSFGGSVEQKEAYIEKWAPTAQQLHFETGVPASVQLAQAIYESGGGISDICKEGNAHFGIRYFKGQWDGPTVAAPKGTLYRAYPSGFDCYYDHACFLQDNYTGAVGKPWQHWVKYATGYGGAADYWDWVKYFIERYNLEKYD